MHHNVMIVYHEVVLVQAPPASGQLLRWALWVPCGAIVVEYFLKTNSFFLDCLCWYEGCSGCTRCEGFMAGFPVAFFLILVGTLPLPIGLFTGPYLHCNVGCFH